MITLLKKIAIRPMDEPFNIVELVNIMEGVDGSATFGYSLEATAIQVEDNQKQQYKHTHTFDVRVIEESSDSATIDAWIADQKRVQIAGQGIDGLFFMDDVLLTRNKQYDGIIANAFLATADTLTWYTTGVRTLEPFNTAGITTATWEKQQIFAASTLFDRFQYDVSKSFRTEGTNTLQHGWIDNTGTTMNVNTSTYNINIARDDAGIGNVYAFTDSYFMPFENQGLIATINVVSVNSNGGGNPEFGITWRARTDSNVNIGRSRVVEIGTSGLKSVAYTGESFDSTKDFRDVHLVVNFPKDGSHIEYDTITFNTTQNIPAGLLNQSSIDITGTK